ncbi:MAG: 4-hydroxythreonine-4-phosphate dehydrogenase PdxA [Fuerstiella sp.]|nr:4-hydroxythreonine-4-phosphate dehydrogenase PdxA [Fuerstiella sp.]MCP4855962.1 4-hydroxythreonine-4-phosphate dehydrogenase PdxA [Fuerstiella sp.]
MNRPIIAITIGDVAGIGPEVVARALQDRAIYHVCRPFVIGDHNVLQQASRELLRTVALDFDKISDSPLSRAGLAQQCAEFAHRQAIVCYNPAGDATALSERRMVSCAAGEAAFQYLDKAIDLAQAGTVDGIATAPLNKAALHAAGHQYPGHTEILAERCCVADFAMMLHLSESGIAGLRELVGGGCEQSLHGLSIAHVTLHTSIASVPSLLTTHSIAEKVRLMHRFLADIGCDRKAIAVCALNPHAGEEGLFGDEERDVIEPAVRRFDNHDINVSGPLPVDTLIRRAVAGEFDGVVAMYHDQGHIPIKLIGFDAAVNITLGLPIVRTSPTHGTAFDRAWDPKTPADPSGMIESILTAARLCRRKQHVKR